MYNLKDPRRLHPRFAVHLDGDGLVAQDDYPDMATLGYPVVLETDDVGHPAGRDVHHPEQGHHLQEAVVEALGHESLLLGRSPEVGTARI